jgi:transcriptional regulator with XRE-family HTH domain
MIEIGETIRQRRELLHLLQPDLAAISKTSRRTIQLIEMGKGNPSLETLLKIANPLGLTLKILLKDTTGNNTINQ